MLFNSLKFLFLFFPATYFVFWRLRRKNQRYIWLTIASYVFYGAWNYKFCALMAFSTLISFLSGLAMAEQDKKSRKKLYLVVPIAIDLLLLGYFKYANFGLHSIASLANWFHWPLQVDFVDVILPVGISFYTFHTITYIVDCYRGVVQPTRNLFEFACYVSLFPQLVAGPIVRFRQIEADLEHIDGNEQSLNRAWSFFVIGMIKKVLVADTIAAVIDPALARYDLLSTAGAWLCIVGYTYQLYFDFSGYSDMAVGLGYMFGLRLPQNFNSPYKATDIADFWRRWHISLSSCLRDYLYIPMGGGREGVWKTNRNLLITMLLGGLWHGANWTFVLWGGYHGILLALNRRFSEFWARIHVAARRVTTFLVVAVGWVLFRSSSLTMAGSLFSRMFHYQRGGLMPGWIVLASMLVVATALVNFAPNTFEISHEWRPAWSGVLAAGYILCLIVIAGAKTSPFLYFQF